MAEDRLLWDAEAYFPGGQLQLLAQEIDAGVNGYPSLIKLEQYARLKVWIGRFRFYQASQDREVEVNDELQALSHRVFHQLKWLSRQYEPGYIEAFRQDFSTDWATYVAEAQEQLNQAIEACRRVHTPELQSRHDRKLTSIHMPMPGVYPRVLGSTYASLPLESVSPATAQFQAATSSLAGLEALVARIRLPDQGLAQFLATGCNKWSTMLALPIRSCFGWFCLTGNISTGRRVGALRYNLERIQPQNRCTVLRCLLKACLSSGFKWSLSSGFVRDSSPTERLSSRNRERWPAPRFLVHLIRETALNIQM